MNKYTSYPFLVNFHSPWLNKYCFLLFKSFPNFLGATLVQNLKFVI